jgi:hypothetical protein
MVIDFGRGTFDVDGLIAMSSTAIRQLRFDEECFTGFHGYDIDIGIQAKSAGLRVVVADLDVFHDSFPYAKITDRAAHLRADRSGAGAFLTGLLVRVVWTTGGLGLGEKMPRLFGPAADVVPAGLAAVRRRVRAR